MTKTNAQNPKPKTHLPRPPIVVILGHVDHGKTTLLDYIRKTTVAAREAGGITQSIGAYAIEHSGKKITFIDTPGHEAFSKMRARGANAADLAILVVAADDGVKPQTKESIETLKSTNTPFVVAINKIDKNNADPEKTKNDLLANGVLLEGLGGNVSWQAISAKTGEGVNELLDFILLAAEMENLIYDPEADGNGFITESKMDKRQGIAVSVIVKNGTLKIGSNIKTPTASGKVKNLTDFLGKPAKELLPSSPALILGFNNLPQIGEEFTAGEGVVAESEKISAPTEAKQSLPATAEENGSSVKLIIKADVAGSLEALSEIIKNLPSENIKIVDEGVGEITAGDIQMAQSTGAMIIGFRTKVDKTAQNLAKAQDTKIVTSEIIYELIKKVEEELERLKSPEPTGRLEILAVFSAKGKRQLVGGKITSGSIKNKVVLEIKRGEEVIGRGRVQSLQSQKQDVPEVQEGKECGIIIESDTKIEVGDMLLRSN